MDSNGLIIPLSPLSSFVFILLCLWLCLAVFRKMYRRLSPPGKRLACVLLAMQFMVIFVSQVLRPTSDFQAWLWSIGNEWTIESVLSSTQFALVGLVALLICWLNTAERLRRRIHLVAVALLFLYLGLDEYFAWKNYLVDWTDTYFVFGALFATMTLIVMETSSRPARQWLLYLILGLSTAAFGAFAVDNLSPKICDVSIGFTYLDGCVSFGLLDELLELAGGWIAMVAILVRFAEVIPAESARIGRILYLLPVLWSLFLVQSNAVHPLEDQVDVIPAKVEFESGVTLKGYRTKLGSDSVTVNFYMAPTGWEFNQSGFSLHLLDQVSGESIAGVDKVLNRNMEFYVTPGLSPAYRQWAKVALPPNKPTNRALYIVMTVWRREGDAFDRQGIVKSDLQVLAYAQVVLGEVVFPPATSDSALSYFRNGFVLVAVDVPLEAQKGDSMPITFSWASEKDGSENHSQFLHLRHEDSGEWWVYDQQPLGPRLPTRLWYSGLADSEVWNVPLPEELAPGKYEVFTGLYRVRDKERVPVRAENGQPWPDARAKLGHLTVNA